MMLNFFIKCNNRKTSVKRKSKILLGYVSPEGCRKQIFDNSRLHQIVSYKRAPPGSFLADNKGLVSSKILGSNNILAWLPTFNWVIICIHTWHRYLVLYDPHTHTHVGSWCPHVIASLIIYVIVSLTVFLLRRVASHMVWFINLDLVGGCGWC